ncbi:MAG: hypothetical protein M1482_03535, partial [Chloroflexi bacterium]|nr:hypothetical protein [Chloroflexota bacterium]
MENRIIHMLSGAFLFRDLAPDDLAQIIQAAHTRMVGRDEFFFHQGEAAATLYILTDGEARLLSL